MKAPTSISLLYYAHQCRHLLPISFFTYTLYFSIFHFLSYLHIYSFIYSLFIMYKFLCFVLLANTIYPSNSYFFMILLSIIHKMISLFTLLMLYYFTRVILYGIQPNKFLAIILLSSNYLTFKSNISPFSVSFFQNQFIDLRFYFFIVTF